MIYKILLSISTCLIFSNYLIAEALPGWTHTKGEETFAGVKLKGKAAEIVSAKAGDLDNDPTNGLETVFVTANAVVTAVKSNGKKLWSYKLPNNKCAALSDTNKAFSTPAIADINGNGKLEVVVGYGGIGAKVCGGGVVALKGKNGKKKWHLDLVAFAKNNNIIVPELHSVFSSPAIKDIDGDNKAEIAFGSFDRHIYVVNHRGKVRWMYHTADTVWSSPTWIDIDGDEIEELVIGSDITASEGEGTLNGGYLYALKIKIPENKQFKFIKFNKSKGFLWQTYFDQIISSSPSIGELLPDNPGLEVAIGSGCFFPEKNKNKLGKWVKILSLQTGEVLQTLDTDVCITSSPAIADINEDGLNEIVIYQSGSKKIGGDGKTKVIAFDPVSGARIWETLPEVATINYRLSGQYASAAIADFDHNGSLEIAITHLTDAVILSGKTGEQLSCKVVDCRLLPNDRMETGGFLNNTPLVADINNDGILDIAVAGKLKGVSKSKGAGHVWTNLSGVYSSEPGIYPAGTIAWGGFKHLAEGNAIATEIKDYKSP